MAQPTVTALEIVEDFTSTGRCDEGFLHVRRLRVRNRRSDDSTSKVYRVDVVDRPRLDAVAVIVWRQGAIGLEFLIRQNLRPAAYFRKDRSSVVADDRSFLYCDEIVAGLLEPTDQGEGGLQQRAAAEVFEEAGYKVTPGEIELLGPPFFVAPGILSEKIFLAAVDVTGKTQGDAPGDGSPLEEGGDTSWLGLSEMHAAIQSGRIQDAKTELGFMRFLNRRMNNLNRETFAKINST